MYRRNAKLILISLAWVSWPLASAARGVEGAVCRTPTGATGVSYAKLPPSLIKALKARVGDFSPPGGLFDGGDALARGPAAPHFQRLMFAWRVEDRWVLAMERGGIAYTQNLFTYGAPAMHRAPAFIGQSWAPPHELCALAARRLGLVPARRTSRVRR